MTEPVTSSPAVASPAPAALSGLSVRERWASAPARAGTGQGDRDGPTAHIVDGTGQPVVPTAKQAAATPPRSGFPLALAVALACHAGILALLTEAPPSLVGSGGIALDAVSVEVEVLPATALESRTPAPAAVASAAAQIDTTEGTSAAEAAMAPPPAPAPVPPTNAAPAPRQVVLEVRPETPDPDALSLPAAETKPEPPPQTVTETTEPAPREADAERIEAAPRPQPQVESALPAERQAAAGPPAGGAAARGAAADRNAATGAAAARAGHVTAYARSIVSALARTAPRSAGSAGKGTVVVRFAVAEDGGLDDIEVQQSSGRPRLDAMAVAAVRATRFPAAPPGMSLADRTYVVPYHFR